MIEVEDLRKQYGGLHALRGVSFEVDRGQVVGLLGPNGAGKSTTMRIVTGFISPTSGTARVGGVDVTESPIACQRQIGYLPENNPHYREMRMIESLRFVAEMHGLRGAERDKAIDKAIRLVGLTGRERQLVGTLSKGFRQRVGLAQALLHEPPVLILDEPTSGLDPIQQEEMRTLVRELGRDRTVILSTHILPEVEAVCGRVLIISEGLLVADGSPDEIRAQVAGGGRAIAVVRGEAEAVTAAFTDLPGVENVVVASDDPDSGLCRVAFSATDQIERALLERIAAAAGAAALPLSELRVERATLEQTFASLTTGDGATTRLTHEEGGSDA